MSFKVAIVGRPNTGKSSLFNRIIGARLSITNDEAGVTRDRIYAQSEWLTKKFSLIDTGGIDIGDAPFLNQIKEQAQFAMDEADVIVFVVDGKMGVTDSDQYISKLLYKTNKPVILAVNKIDDISQMTNVYEFYQLGFDEPVAISSHHGIGIGDLLDRIIKYYEDRDQTYPEQTIRFSVIGRPNVGKSSLTNAILGTNRVIVSDVSGTTRDAIDTPFKRDKKDYVVIDTAGIKKRGTIYEETDRYSLLRAQSAIERSDICLLLIDGAEGVIEQDKHVASYAVEENKSIVIVVNKWDLVIKDEKTMNKYMQKIRDDFKFLEYAEVVFVSAKEKSRLNTLFDAINSSYENYCKEIKTNIINDLLQDAVAMNPTPIYNHGKAQFNYATQVAIKPPTFVLFVNQPDYVHFSYLRYLNNQFRSAIDFKGTPIKLILRRKNDNEY